MRTLPEDPVVDESLDPVANESLLDRGSKGEVGLVPRESPDIEKDKHIDSHANPVLVHIMRQRKSTS